MLHQKYDWMKMGGLHGIKQYLKGHNSQFNSIFAL